jgi:hypothetical protein
MQATRCKSSPEWATWVWTAAPKRPCELNSGRSLLCDEWEGHHHLRNLQLAARE